MDKNNFDEAREKFFDFLLKKPCTHKQAADYLSRRDTPEQYKDILLTEAQNLGLVDDLAYARLFVDGHLAWGNAKITFELEGRGISREDINAALAESEDESSRASEASKSWRNLGLDQRKIINRLLSRGFSLKAARSVFQN
ncbi:MAG: RecX family transcriptional regulator [Synergistaceae bacterium]|nr:RecX family transcriptional regulator [Synergistaceae bacterium]